MLRCFPVDRSGISSHFSAWIHPDFTILRRSDRKEVYWEHLGMMDDPEYAANALMRIDLYERNGIFPGDRLILTHETGRQPLRTRLIEVLAERIR